MNSEQFMRVVDHTRPVVVAQCRRALRKHPVCPVVELRDLVQEVLVEMWRSRDRLGTAHNQRGWAALVAWRTACRCLRRLRP